MFLAAGLSYRVECSSPAAQRTWSQTLPRFVVDLKQMVDFLRRRVRVRRSTFLVAASTVVSRVETRGKDRGDDFRVRFN
jgi:hypothetical protein